MGRRIISQKRGKGSPAYREAAKGKVAPVAYPFHKFYETRTARIVDIVHEKGRAAPIAQLQLTDGRMAYIPAVEGMVVGETIEIGYDASVKTGNILPLSRIPEGTIICNIEKCFGDGGKLVRAAGGSAILFSHTPDGAVVRLPSGKSILLDGKCRAMIGKIAGEGRLEKPLLKAGAKYYAVKGTGKVFPKVRGVAMAAVHHPFGGGRHQHPGKPTSTHRHAPPGRKVGHIAPRKTGRKHISRKALARGG